MRATSDLWKLRLAFIGRLQRIREVFSRLVGCEPRQRGQIVSFSVIELDNLVLATMRSLLLSTFRQARTVKGSRITLDISLRKEDEIAAYVLSVLQPYVFVKKGSPQSISRWHEPTIRDPRDIEKIFLAVGASNTSSLQNALGLNTTLFSNLATVRNFYAHRNDDTWRKVRTLSINQGYVGISHPDHFVTRAVYGRPVVVFDDWLDDAELFFTEATE